MSDKFFSPDGRCVTSFTKNEVHAKSRNYFRIDQDRFNKVKLNTIFNNIKNNLCPDEKIEFSEFENRITSLKNNISKNSETKNISNNILIPFFLPKIKIDDIGETLEQRFFPALQKSFKSSLPDYEFVNHQKGSLKNKIKIRQNTRYEKLLSELSKRNIVGLISPSLNEFSFPAALDTIPHLPAELIGSGGIEILAGLIGCPNLLHRDDGYPPLLWFTSSHEVDDENIGYHVEAYGNNLTYNRRAHLSQAAEYWWHSLTIID